MLKKAGKWFSPEEAADYIGGYVIFNDITARDIQRGEMRSGVFSFCKAIDTFCPLGPWIVTPDEIPDPHDLAMELRVNDEVRQESHSSRMSVTIPEILSNFSALGYSAGDVLSTGTVAGVAGFKSKEERDAALSEARRRDRGGDRAHRRVADTRDLVAARGTARLRRRGCARGATTFELAPRRREARPRPRADGRARARRARRAGTRQRALPDELLGDEGLRRVCVPARRRARADLSRGVGRRCRAVGLDERRALRAGLRRGRSSSGAGAHARRGARCGEGLRQRRARAVARDAGVGPDGRRADDVHEGVVRRLARRRRTRCPC